MTIANISKNAKYIGYECVVCKRKIDEDERQKLISLGFLQTWCMLCGVKKYPADRHLANYITSNGVNNVILDRNKLLNDEVEIQYTNNHIE